MPHKYVLAINNGGAHVKGRQVHAEWSGAGRLLVEAGGVLMEIVALHSAAPHNDHSSGRHP